MNAELIKRIVRAISSGSQRDLDQLARRVVQTERKAGHGKLASELEQILNRPRELEPRAVKSTPQRSLHELPVSRRDRELLATLLPRESLEHHMVLSPSTEARFCRIEQEYAARERLGVHGLRPRKSILLHGPPGCGKSLGAKRLAWNTGLPLMKVRFDALISSYFGESLSNLRAIFDAVRKQPCVLLLDECDFIARAREGSRDIGEASRLVSMLLQLMEEFDAPGLVVATTNLESSLDEALFRRFDEVLQVPPPSPEEVLSLLRMTLSGVDVDHSVKWGSIVKRLEGHSAADVVKVAQDAAKAAVLSGGDHVAERHLRVACSDLHKP